MDKMLKLELANAMAEKLWMQGHLSDRELSKIKEQNKKKILENN